MPITNLTKIANRFGLNLSFYEYTPDGTIATDATPLVFIDFANEVGLELSSELTWATGGQSHSNMVGFKDPTTGTFKISTQIIPTKILQLAAGVDITEDGNKVSFKNDKTTVIPKYYIIVGDTVWQGEDGTTYTEKITVFKACVKPGYSVTYNGSGDPQSLDIEFELGTNDAGNLVDIERADEATDENA